MLSRYLGPMAAVHCKCGVVGYRFHYFGDRSICTGVKDCGARIHHVHTECMQEYRAEAHGELSTKIGPSCCPLSNPATDATRPLDGGVHFR
eukprot:scaffold2238_cov396-Prasinococcus_capsulatus_cf.AAC.2